MFLLARGLQLAVLLAAAAQIAGQCDYITSVRGKSVCSRSSYLPRTDMLRHFGPVVWLLNVLQARATVHAREYKKKEVLGDVDECICV